MDVCKRLFFLTGLVQLVLGLSACLDSAPSGDIEKTRQLAALRNVSLNYDSTSIELQLPDTIIFRLHFKADNTDDAAKDARFEGMISNLTFDTLAKFPLNVVTDAFFVPKDSVVPISGTGVMDRASHEKPIEYIFQQMIFGEKVEAILRDTLLYDLGSLSGRLGVPPPIPISIPTRADSSTKKRLKLILEAEN